MARENTSAPGRRLGKALKNARHQVRTLGLWVILQAGLYPFRKAYNQARYGGLGPGAPGTRTGKGLSLRGLRAILAMILGEQPQHTRLAYESPGRVLSYRPMVSDRGTQEVELACERATMRISILAADLVRVSVRAGDAAPTHDSESLPSFSYAVDRDDAAWPPVEVDVVESADALLIRTTRLHCRADRERATIAFLDPDGTLIHSDAAPVSWDAQRAWTRSLKRLLPGEHIYGLGQKTTRLDKRGLAFEMWNTDRPNYRPGDDPIYSNIPFYLGLVEADGERRRTFAYGFLLDHPTRARFDFGARSAERTSIEHGTEHRGDVHRCYFFYGPQLRTVLERYTELTGRPAMLPLWALGYHQNRWSYSPEARVREIAREFRRRRIPCDAIHLDIDYMDGFRCFTWHPRRFPDPARLIVDLHAQGFKVVTMIDPGIRADPSYRVCREGLERGMFCTYPDGKPFDGPVWPGKCYFPDFTSPRVRAWWGELYGEMVDLGVDGFWNDMNEPVVFGHAGDTFPDVVQHDWEGQGADHRVAHNVYGMQMARATVEGLCRLRPTERPLVISRSVWAGSQRYNTHWLGDNYSDWDALRNVPQMVMNMGLSGMPFTGPDTGGFIGTADAELLIRWNQLGAFTPFFRNHTAKTSGDQEPWALGAECERISRAFIELRYRLLPYHYTALWQSTQSGMPLMRPLCLSFQEKEFAVHGAKGYSPDDEFMFGDALLVAPILEPGRTARQVYVPPGTWYDFWGNTTIDGPQIARMEAPLERIPVLVRAGSIVPTWPTMQYVGELPIETLTLHAYPGDGESSLYEDDGHTWAFRQGAYRLTRLTSQVGPAKSAGADLPLSRWLRISRQGRGIFVPPYHRIQLHVHGIPSRPQEIVIDDRSCCDPGDQARFDPLQRTLTFETGLFQDIEIRLDSLQKE